MHWVEALTRQGLPKAEAQAQSIAAQIWAEMLGIVCHPEYYKLGEQKVPSTNDISLILGLRSSLLRFPRLDLLRNIPSRISLHNPKRRHQRVEIKIQKSPSSSSYGAL